MFSSVSSLKSSFSPRSSFTNLPPFKCEQLLSTFEKDKENNNNQNQEISIRGFESIRQYNQPSIYKSSSIERYQSQESLDNLEQQRRSFMKRAGDQERVNRFFKNSKDSRMSMVRSVDGISQGNCYNLDGKKAKYVVLDSQEYQNKQYCSKCSIMLLQKGHKITEISESASIQNTSNQRAELQQLTVKLNRIQSDIKSQLSNLQHNYFFSTIQTSKHQIQQTYNKILDLIFRMKEDDLNILKTSKENILKQTQNQKKILLNNNKIVENIKQTLFDVSRNLTTIAQSQYKHNISEALKVIQSNKRYQSLEFSIKQENEEKTIERVVEEVKGKLLRAVEFSFDNIKRTGVIEQCDESFEGSLQESFRGIFSCYRKKGYFDN